MTKNRRLACAVVFLVGLVAALVVTRAFGSFDRDPTGDAPYFLALAKSLAGGKGYVYATGPWPDQPHLARMPLWPAILSVPIRALPNASPAALLRITTAFLHSLTAMLVLLLIWRVWGDEKAAWIGGLAQALYLPAISLVDAGYSEHAWMVAFLGGLVIAWGRTGMLQLAGVLLMGLSVLARANFLLLPFLAVLILLVHRDLKPLAHQMRSFIALSLLFVAPGVLWMARNYQVSGVFPLLSAQEGETLYGANNDVVAEFGRTWGYWIFPDEIPGETPKLALARTMSEAALHQYYQRKGFAYIKEHLASFPLLAVGKMIRGFLPLPWVPGLKSYVASSPRLLLYLLFVWALWKHGMPKGPLGVLMIAMFLTILLTTIVFYGSYRFTICLEPFMICWTARVLVLRRSSNNLPFTS